MPENPTKGRSRDIYHSASGRTAAGTVHRCWMASSFRAVNRACTEWLQKNDPTYSSKPGDFTFGGGKRTKKNQS